MKTAMKRAMIANISFMLEAMAIFSNGFLIIVIFDTVSSYTEKLHLSDIEDGDSDEEEGINSSDRLRL